MTPEQLADEAQTVLFKTVDTETRVKAFVILLANAAFDPDTMTLEQGLRNVQDLANTVKKMLRTVHEKGTMQ